MKKNIDVCNDGRNKRDEALNKLFKSLRHERDLTTLVTAIIGSITISVSIFGIIPFGDIPNVSDKLFSFWPVIFGGIAGYILGNAKIKIDYHDDKEDK